MRIWVLSAAIALIGGSAFAGDHVVHGYTKKDGTVVQPYHRTDPNGTTSDNYSTRGNVNPWTGAPGTQPDTRPSYGYSPPVTTPAYRALCRDGTTETSTYEQGLCAYHGGRR